LAITCFQPDVNSPGINVAVEVHGRDRQVTVAARVRLPLDLVVTRVHVERFGDLCRVVHDDSDFGQTCTPQSRNKILALYLHPTSIIMIYHVIKNYINVIIYYNQINIL
jgi:hypothetical protein